MTKDLLLIIDMQNVYGKGGAWYCPSIDQATKKLIQILDQNQTDPQIDIAFTTFIASTNPIGIWKQYNLENNEVNQDHYANELISSFIPYTKNYPIYEKSTYSSLTIPALQEKVMEYDRIVISGVVAECCVLATAMQLIDAGCKVVYLVDGVAGINQETEKAVKTILSGLSPLHVELISTEEYLEEINQKGESKK